jgi:pimeloyl-ACP methyl ester carboxylesterase
MRIQKRLLYVLLTLLLLLTSCRPDPSDPGTPELSSVVTAVANLSPGAGITPSNPAVTAPTTTPLPKATATKEPKATPTPAVDPTPAVGPPPAETPLPTATQDPTSPSVVTIPGVDNITSTGTFYPGLSEPPWPGVILLHMSGGNRYIWEENGFAEMLVKAGYAVLAVDIRNHGDSGGDPSWENGEADIRRWWNYFSSREDVDESRTALVGGSIGANLALFTGAAKTSVRTIVLLSPGLSYNSAPVADTVVDYGGRPMYIVASADDLFPAVEDAESMADIALGTVQLQLYEDAGHGTEMLSAKPELAGLIISWLDTHVKPTSVAGGDERMISLVICNLKFSNTG